MSLAVRFDDIRKDFGPVRVLHGVSFDLAPGRIYGLLGENGAGKSTLMKILAGYETATEGTVLIDGHARQFDGSRDAEAAGIVLIHQEFNLAEHLTIAQNMYLGHEKRKGLFVDDTAMRSEAKRYLEQVGLHRHPDTKVRDLIVAEKQMVEIAKALSRRARLRLHCWKTGRFRSLPSDRKLHLRWQRRRAHRARARGTRPMADSGSETRCRVYSPARSSSCAPGRGFRSGLSLRSIPVP